MFGVCLPATEAYHGGWGRVFEGDGGWRGLLWLPVQVPAGQRGH